MWPVLWTGFSKARGRPEFRVAFDSESRTLLGILSHPTGENREEGCVFRSLEF